MAQSYNLTVKPANNVITIARDPGARIALIVIKQKKQPQVCTQLFYNCCSDFYQSSMRMTDHLHERDLKSIILHFRIASGCPLHHQ
jgi:hypothetical protein